MRACVHVCVCVCVCVCECTCVDVVVCVFALGLALALIHVQVPVAAPCSKHAAKHCKKVMVYYMYHACSNCVDIVATTSVVTSSCLLQGHGGRL